MVYTIEKKPYGIKLSFDGMMDEEIAKNFAKEFMQVLNSIKGEIGILIDLSKGKPMPPAAQAAVNDCYKAVVQKGLTRSANIVSSAIMKTQMTRRAKEFGTYNKARYIESTTKANAEQIALDWIEKGIDPDQ